MTHPGWFPDPDGTPDRWRFWDGQRWTSDTRVHHDAPASGPRPAPGRSGGSAAVLAGLGLTVVVALACLIYFGGLHRLVPAGLSGSPGDGPSTMQVCPTQSQSAEAPDPQPAGRVVSGPVSIEALGGDWEPAYLEPRVPYGHHFMRQQILIDRDPPWVTSVAIGTVTAGDGFAGPKDGVHAIIDCVIAEYYRDITLTRDDLVDRATTVDGHPGWRLETRLTFDVSGLAFRTERFVLVLADLGDGSCAAFIADIPAPADRYEKQIRAAEKSIRIR